MIAAPLTFHRRTEDALADRQLNGTLRRVTARILESRTAGLERLPGSDEWRDHARGIRANIFSALGESREPKSECESSAAFGSIGTAAPTSISSSVRPSAY